MIRVVTLEPLDSKQLEKFCQTLYTAFAVGTEHSGEVGTPPTLSEPFDTRALIEQLEGVRAYKDDKILYLTTRKLKERDLPSGVCPTAGFAKYALDRALISLHPAKDLEAAGAKATRQALHQLGHLWELHHCLDPRCSMYPPWTPSFVTGEAIFCNFCREKSEAKVRLAKS